MTKICGLILGVVTTLTFAACGSDDSAGTHGTGGSSATGTGGASTGTGGSATGTTGGSATGTTGGSATGTTGGSTSKGGAASTGGSAAATGGSGGANACQTTCQKLKAANCGDFTEDCATPCTATGTCAAEENAFDTCAASMGTVSCDTAMNTVITGCDAANRAANVCFVCEPQTGDTACDTCTETSCCTELKTYVSAADVQAFSNCIGVCTTQACVDTCVGMYPTAGKSYNDAVDCQSKGCVNECVCAADASDSSCLACVKANCCADFGTLVNASDINAYNACTDMCAMDAACFDACAVASPVAGAAFDALDSTCLSTTCTTECS